MKKMDKRALRKYLNKEQIESIINLYEDGKSGGYISKLLDIDITTVYYQVRKAGKIVKNASESSRKYTLNENYFETIDSEDKAYFLGLIAADGCVTDENKILINLQEEDKYILEKLILCVNYGGQLYSIAKRTVNHKNQSRLQITSKLMAKQLYNLSITPRKSLTLKFPLLPNTLIKDFIRGYFDGDGCIKITKGVFYIRFIGTLEFLTILQQHLITTCQLSSVKMYQAKKDKNTFELTYGGDLQCLKIYSYLYENSTIFLTRKKNKFIEHITKRLSIYKDFILQEEINSRKLKC